MFDPKKILQAGNIFAAICIAAVLFNSVPLYREITRTYGIQKKIPPIFFGVIFSGLDQFLPGVSRVGYYTDKDFDKQSDAAEFAQAQYIMAPIILDLDYEDHEWIIFNCTTEKKAFEAIKMTGAVPVKRNQFGIILARRTPDTSTKTIQWKSP